MSVKRSSVQTAIGRVVIAACLTPIALAAQGAQWRSILPAGPTRCAFDTPFEFRVSEGDPARILVYLQGGGACWDLDSCDPRRRAAYDTRVDSADAAQHRSGVFDRGQVANPFREHTLVFVPYCTGDLHLGARRVTYRTAGDSGSVTVHHAGYHNVRAVLDYLAARPRQPSEVTVIGASAGSVASPFVAAELARVFPRADVRQIGDGGGAFRAPAIRRLLAGWGVDSLMSALGMPLTTSGDVIAGMYKAAAERQPRVRFSQVSTSEDAVVSAWLRRVGEDPGRVAANIDETYAELRAAPLCFTGFVLPGAVHTIFWRPELYAAHVAGRPLIVAVDRDVLRSPCTRPRGDAAFLFAYRAKPDMDAAFGQGYRRHLDWHVERNDSLPWLAWTVVDGAGVGTFVDGTFGIPFKAFDDRVDLRGDAEDAARNVNAYATAVSRQVYRLRRDLGSSARLETRRPGAMQKVVRLTVRPGSERAFEDVVKSVATVKDVTRRLDFSVYEQLSGGDAPAYVVIVQLAGWAELDDANADVTRAILRTAGSAIVRAESEIWSYRPELTYFPQR